MSEPRLSEPRRLIAIVDDEPSVCRALERLLRAAKFDVVTFGSGTEFLASMITRNARRPDCLVLDLHMPELNGFDVQARLSADRSRRIGVVAITAHESTEARDRALAAGASAYLRKPVEAQPLLDAIRSVLAAATKPTQPAAEPRGNGTS